jgi:hypothetical protein
MSPTPFDGTVDAMAAVMQQAREQEDRIGEFAAMYGAVTRRVRYLAERGAFEDADRMAAFVDRFAARFLDAVTARDEKRPVTRSWSAAFVAAGEWRIGVLRNLLLGMTAHIGLDLGVVAAEVASGAGSTGLEGMRPDFDAVNDVLSSLVPRVEAAVGQLSPAIGLLDKAGGRADAFAISRVIAVARDMAWRNALELTSLATSERAGAVDHIDAEVAEMAHAMVHPGLAMSSLFLPIRAMERRSLGESMDVLGSIDAEP